MTPKMLDMGRKRSGEKTVPIRVSEKVAHMIDVICLAEKTSNSAIATPILEPALMERYQEALATIASTGKEIAKKTRRDS